ncbi:LytTR family DNA-binding domain-containing protein [Sphingopyxis solisilvae]|uniref:LytTR family DNA-binding domain-containing protein n=1 Tax=Sphingopyxis solisilvae TaxID=1886788 RepID=UPI001892B285|nr:LytTR family DNA-binding domain-containing protein [Sphingopyxis solisilvae]
MARKIAIESFLMIVAGIILALIGPFGSYELPLVQRLILWPLMILCGYPIFGGLGAVARWLAEAVRIPYAVTIALGLIVGSMPMTLLVMLLWRRASIDQALQSPLLGAVYLQVLVIGVIIHTAMYLLFRPAANPEPTAPPLLPPTLQPTAGAPDSGTAASIAPNLPLPPGFGPVRALKGEDHYVRVIGDGREELILMRLRDAIERLGTTDGLRVHRSWWVARGGVIAVRRDGRVAAITLVGGQEVPVSRDMMPQLRAAGWL